MKIKTAICGSMQFFKEMKALKSELESLGVFAYLPEVEEKRVSLETLSEKEVSKLKKEFIKAHLEKIKNSSSVLIANYTKNNIKGYIGANTLMEMAFAYALDKKIYVLFKPGDQPCKEEFLGMEAVILNQNLERMIV